MSVDKLDMQSANLVNQNIEKLAELFPNCVTESDAGKAIDFDLLRQELNHAVVEGNKERYRLEWPGKKEAIVSANLPTTKTLRPVHEDSVNFYNTENIYIEGDNLEVLKLLQESYLGKIKTIYIDPPYNTGKDFVYKDNFAKDTQDELFESGQKDEYNQRLVVNPETAGRYHSNWLSMMYPRLKLARNLLKEDGVIFISIDDNEVHNLKKICDEIFGESSYKNSIAVRRGIKNVQAQFDDLSALSQGHEYILLYSKTDETRLPKLMFSHGEKKPGKWDTFWRGTDRPTMRYNLLDITPKSGQWRWEEKRAFEAVKNYEIYLEKYSETMSLDEWFLDNLTSTNLKLNFLRKSENGVVQYYVPPSEGKLLSDNWMDITLSGNETKEFDTEKNAEILMRAIRWITRDEDIILDFFSGSATTAHAVMNLNAEYKDGKLKYIMVQLPEAVDEKSEAYKAGYKNICEIGKERIRRAANKIKVETGADIDYGFRVYRLDESNMQDVYYKPQEYLQANLDLFADNIKSDRTADDLLAQVMLDWGLPLSLKIERLEIGGKEVFRVAENSLYACFDKGLDETFAKEIAKDKPLRVVFRDNGFKDDTAKVNVKQLLKQLSPETEMKVI
ncbi:site-specific DNA-methyltransferase [Sphingobacterium sp. 18053]|uniref:site-specific DNA-methyltransferase n=1 Tax=Sphingobacterium sp. 18053 TaxID=2681401 RepID=UPI0013597B1B|nr:site-specific DNA-methyltransferase [Sphingobacterium sp. 18053]